MKKILQIIILIPVFLGIAYLMFIYQSGINAISLYKVYLNGNVIGIIESQEELEDYIDEMGEYYKDLYNVDSVYAPEGIEIKKIDTYTTSIDKIEEVYYKIAQTDPFTIEGYEFTIKKEEENLVLNVLDTQAFDEAIEQNYIVYVGEEDYQLYINEEQDEIDGTGSLIENVYIDEDITVKEKYISVEDKIYTDVDSLAQYLIFGEDNEMKEYTVKIGDTIESIAFDHKIGTGEFLISNPSFSNEKDLLFPGQIVTIEETNPQISVVIEKFVIEDKVEDYQVEYQYLPEEPTTYENVIQEGEAGLNRVTQRNKIVNGNITYVDNISTEIIEVTTNQIIEKGERELSGVGSTKNWLWPTNSGYTITQNYAWRIHPIYGYREFHQALDIAGTGYGSNIYATTDGVVEVSKYQGGSGYYVCINHNVESYYTCYLHLTKLILEVGDVVERGQVIGYMGATGAATGPHLHFEVWKGKPYSGGYKINPWTMY